MSVRVKPNFIVRALQPSDCEEVRQIWATVGFDIARRTNEIMLTTDPDGMKVVQDTDTGKLIGYCNGINITNDLAFIGGFSIRPEYQGVGIGSVLWQNCMEHMGERNIAIFSGPNMWTKYRDRSGFGIVGNKLLLRFGGKAKLDELIDSIDGISLQSINEKNIENVIKYDKTITNGIDRTEFIKGISKAEESVNLVAINNKNEVLGYCVIMLTLMGKGTTQPIYANDEKIAELLVKKCCQLLPNTTEVGFTYVCWNTNEKSVAIAKKLGLEVSSNGSGPKKTLFTKEVVEGNMDKIYCVASRCFYPF